MSDINDEVHAVAEHLRRLNMEFDRYGNLTAQSADAIRKKTSAETYRDQMLAQSGQAAAQGLQSLYRAASTYTSAMYEGQRGSAALNSTITQVTSGLGSLATALAFLVTPGGPLKKILVAGITQLGAKTLEVAAEMDNASRDMVSKQMDAYERLTQTGAIAGEGLTGLGEGAARVGVSIFKMDKYLSLIGGNSGTLSLFAGSAAKGRRQFEELGEELKSERSRFKLLGMDQDAMNEGMMGYVRLLTLTGNIQNVTTKDLKEGVKKYLIEQDALTKLTGVSRKQAEELAAQALSEERFNAEQMELRENGQVKEAENIKNFNIWLSSIAPQLGQGFRAGNDMSAPGAVEYNQALNGAGAEIRELVKRDLPAAMNRVVQEVARSEKDFRGLANYGASGFAGNQAEKARLVGLRGKDFVKMAAEIGVDQGKQVGEGKDEKGNPITVPADPRLEREVKLLDSQQETNILLQRLINEGFNNKIFGPGGADSAQMTALRAQQTAEEYVRAAVKARNPKLLEKKEKETPALTLKEAEAAVTVRDNEVQETGKQLKNLNTALESANTELNKAKTALNSAGSEADKQIAKTELDQALRNKKALEAAQKDLEAEFKKEIDLRDQARKDLEKLKKAPPAVVAPKDKDTAKDNVPPAGETDLEKQARIKKESEAKAAEAEKAKAAEAAEKAKSAETKAAEAKAAEAAKKAADEAAAKKAAEESKKKEEAKETAKISLLPNGARVLDDVLELVKQGVPVISNVRTQEEQDKLKDHQDEKGNWFTKNNLPVAEDSKHLTGDAIDVRTKDMTEDLEKLLKDSGWMRPLPKSDPGHWQRVPKKEDKKTSNADIKNVDLAASLAKNFDLSDATAGLTINSDVATLNSKGMNVSLDSSTDVAKLIMEPVLTQMESSQKDQSAARSNFENSIGDLKSEFAKQKATDELLLAAVQELIRIQKNGVSVNEKILAAQA